MDPVISALIDRYEAGRLSRRELVSGLSALAAAGAAAPALAQPAAPPALKPVGLDHVSILVSDLKRSADFYGRVFGLVTVSEDKANKILRLGRAGSVATAGAGPGAVIVSLREQPPAGKVDHWAFKIEGFNTAAATETLKAHGLTPDRNIEYGFHVKDPDGVVVQMV